MGLKKFKIAACLALLPITLLVFLLPACASVDKKIKITVGIWQGSSADEKEFYEQCKNSFEQKYPQYEIISSPYVYSADTVVAKFASGQLPTVFEADVSLANSALANGYIKDVADYMKNYGWFNKADDYFLSQITADGKVCGVPAEQYSAGMVLNLPLLHQAGVIDCDADGNYILYDGGKAVYPDNFDKLETAARKIAQNCPDGTYGLLLPSGDSSCGKIYTDIIYNFGSGNLEYVDTDGNLKLSLSHNEVGNAMRWVRKMSQEVYVANDEKYGVEAWAMKMANNEVAISFCQSNRLRAALSAEPSLNGNIAFVPLPTAEGVEGGSIWNGKVYAVSGRASDEQVEAAFRFLKFMGYGPDTDAQSIRYAERRFEEAYLKKISVFPVLSVWEDEEYFKKMQELYSKYKNINEEYFKEFFNGFNGRKREGEPYARENLHAVIDELFSKMLFEATTSNLVTLLAESETEFTAKYLSKITI